MLTCETCYYWNREYKIINNISDCDRPKCLPDLGQNVMFNVEVTAHDDQGLDYVLMTGKDFGCIHHKKKDIK